METDSGACKSCMSWQDRVSELEDLLDKQRRCLIDEIDQLVTENKKLKERVEEMERAGRAYAI